MRGKRREARHKVVIATAGNSGDLTLVRLLSAGGEVTCVGSPLAQPVKGPIESMSSALESGYGSEPVRAAFVHPDDLWLMNRLEPVEAIREFARRGWQVITLTRHSPLDRGLSRAVCGGHLEVLPTAPVAIDAADVVVHAHTGRLAAAWLNTQVEPVDRILFENDLVGTGARQALVDRLAHLWDLTPWQAPADPDVPTAPHLWERVQNPTDVRAAVNRLVESLDV